MDITNEKCERAREQCSAIPIGNVCSFVLSTWSLDLFVGMPVSNGVSAHCIQFLCKCNSSPPILRMNGIITTIYTCAQFREKVIIRTITARSNATLFLYLRLTHAPPYDLCITKNDYLFLSIQNVQLWIGCGTNVPASYIECVWLETANTGGIEKWCWYYRKFARRKTETLRTHERDHWNEWTRCQTMRYSCMCENGGRSAKYVEKTSTARSRLFVWKTFAPNVCVWCGKHQHT